MQLRYILVFCGLYGFSMPAMAQTLVTPRSISMTGEAHEEVAPDQAALSGQIVNRDKVLKTAKEANDKRVELVVSIAKQLQIPRNKISASSVYVSPEYVWNQNKNKQEQVGYVVSRNLTITLDKIEIHEILLSKLIEGGIDEINGVNFSIAHPETIQNTLRVKAVQDARAKAAALAEAAGAKLGRVLTITTNGAMPMPMPMVARGAMMKADMAESSVAPSLPGMNNLSESVSVVFELE